MEALRANYRVGFIRLLCIDEGLQSAEEWIGISKTLRNLLKSKQGEIKNLTL
jgi:hypothetical protein